MGQFVNSDICFVTEFTSFRKLEVTDITRFVYHLSFTTSYNFRIIEVFGAHIAGY